MRRRTQERRNGAIGGVFMAQLKYELTVLDWHPVTLNALLCAHWSVRGRLKRGDRDLVGIYAKMAGVPKARGRRRVSLVLTMAPRQRRPDPDAFWKSTLDSLVHAGLLVDDSPKWCELGTVEFSRGEARETRIMLVDIGDGEKR